MIEHDSQAGADGPEKPISSPPPLPEKHREVSGSESSHDEASYSEAGNSEASDDANSEPVKRPTPRDAQESELASAGKASSPLPSPFVLVLGVVYAVAFLLDLAVGIFETSFTSLFALPSGLLFQFWNVWTLITFSWVHVGAWELGGTLLLLLVIGSKLDRQLGMTTTWSLYFAAIFAGGLFWTLAVWFIPGPLLLTGPSAGLAALLTLAACRSDIPKARFGQWQLPARILLPVFLVMDTLAHARLTGGSSILSPAIGVAMGYLFYKTDWHPGLILPRKWWSNGLHWLADRLGEPERETS